jgi:hypothetical protein
MTCTRLAPLALGTALALALTACGDDEAPTTRSSAESASTSAEGGDVDRYCELVAELNALGEQIFAGLPEEAAPEEVMLREQELVEQGAAQLDELERVAPDEIADDVPVVLDDLRARAATGEQPDAEAASAAEERVRAFDEEHCPAGADGS